MNIVTVENEKELRNKCVPIMKEKADYMNNLINSMIKLMVDSNGCGIAAPQVGVNKRLFVAVLDNERIGLFVNPTILEHSEETEVDTEGCLSVPEMCGDVERYKRIKIRYFNGKEIVTEEYEGMNARIIQHEYDHLNGVLYIDKAENIREVQRENWILKDDELPNAYEEVEILMVDGSIYRDMIIRGKYGNLEWRNYEDRSVKAWRNLS